MDLLRTMDESIFSKPWGMIIDKDVAIINYGIGNIGSIANMVRKLSFNPVITSNPVDLQSAQKIILAGVGAFGHGMATLIENRWVEPLKIAVLEKKIPILGICLGMQLMCRHSEEGDIPGLGWIDAEVKRFNPRDGCRIKVPHMGWNTVTIRNDSDLFVNIAEEQRFYFVHSYHILCNNPADIQAVSFHGCEFVSAFRHQNIYGVQFHPEKSHRFGINLIKNFLSRHVETPCHSLLATLQ